MNVYGLKYLGVAALFDKDERAHEKTRLIYCNTNCFWERQGKQNKIKCDNEIAFMHVSFCVLLQPFISVIICLDAHILLQEVQSVLSNRCIYGHYLIYND